MVRDIVQACQREGRFRGRVLMGFCITVHLGIALVPFIYAQTDVAPVPETPPSWPARFEGRALVQVPLTEQERGFTRDFPGAIGRFTDGSRDIVARWIRRASRRLHPASDCLRAVGYTVTPQPIRVDADRQHWGCILAQRGGKRLQVCERIYDAHGGSWSDVSAWYWAAMLGKTSGPWWALTVAENTP